MLIITILIVLGCLATLVSVIITIMSFAMKKSYDELEKISKVMIATTYSAIMLNLIGAISYSIFS